MKTQPTHTPTPWKLSLPDGDSRFRLSFQFPDGSSFTERSGDLSEANAAFIVRAVNNHENLLTAVKLLLDAVDIPSLTKADMKFISEAIAKAEGR